MLALNTSNILGYKLYTFMALELDGVELMLERGFLFSEVFRQADLRSWLRSSGASLLLRLCYKCLTLERAGFLVVVMFLWVCNVSLSFDFYGVQLLLLFFDVVLLFAFDDFLDFFLA